MQFHKKETHTHKKNAIKSKTKQQQTKQQVTTKIHINIIVNDLKSK